MRVGNQQVVVASILFALACLIVSAPVLEQPAISYVIRRKPLATVLAFMGSLQNIAWLGQLGGNTPKPLHYLHVHFAAFCQLARAPAIPRSLQYICVANLLVISNVTFSGNIAGVKWSQAYALELGAAVARASADILFAQHMSV